jgi:tetratricopeptide (TPR) repeat protein
MKARSGRSEAVPRAAKPASRLPWAAFALAVVLPLVHTAFLRGAPTFDVPIIDSAEYVDAAREELSGHSDRSVYFHSPFYSWFLAAVFELFGFRYGLVRVVQAFLNGLTCMVLFALARRVFSSRVATVAAFAWALYAPVIFFSAEILNVSWILLWTTAALYSVVRAAESRSHLSWLLAGGVTGLAAITRADILPFAAVAAFLAWYEQGGGAEPSGRGGRHALVFALGVAVPLLVVGARNDLVAGRFVLLPANAGINFYIGNNPDYRNTIGIRPGVPYEHLKAMPQRAGVAPSTADPAHSAYFYAEAFRYMTSDLRGYLGCLVYKLRILISGLELPETFDVYTTRSSSPLLAVLAFRVGSFGFPFGLFLPLAAWAAWAYRGQARHLRWLGALLVSMMIPLLGYWSSSRYRMAIVPVVVLWAAAGGVALFDLHRRREHKALGIAVAAIVGTSIVCNLPYDHFSRGHRFDAEAYGFAGARLVRQGQPDRGQGLLRKAVELDPGRVEFVSALGYTLLESGRADEAIVHLKAAVALAPELAPAWNNLGTAQANHGEIEAAIESFSRSLRLDPGQDYVRRNLEDLQALRARHSN